MGRYTYEAVDSRGRRLVDSGEARDKESLMLNLQSQGLVLVRWLDKEGPRKSFLKRRKRTLKTSELLQMTRELAHLLKSGLPMDRAFTVISESTDQESIKAMSNSLNEAIRGGSSLSEAIANKPEDFNDLYVNMVRVGEVGGILPDVTEKLGQFMERTEEIKRFIVSSSIYPSILFLVGIISVIVIMGFVVPRFAGIFNDLGQKIPFSTQILISVSVFLRAWWPVILLAAGLIFFVLWRFSRTPAGKNLLDRIVIKAPVFGSLMTDIQVSRFARTLGTLVTSGVPLTKGLSIVQRVVSNSVVRAAVEHIVSQVREGRRVSALMKEKGIFPAMAVQMVSLGEETGRIGEMLVLVAEELDNKIQSRIKSYLALMEPLAILIMGLIIGGIVVSMLSAIFGINEIEF
jgi:general secretion pathway protein F